MHFSISELIACISVSTTTIRGFVSVSDSLFLFMFQVAAENAFMNPMMDPRFAAMWGMPGALDDPQWQQFHQRMQQEQHKQLLEQSKQEFLMGKQGAPFPLASYPFFFGDKRVEQKRKVTVNVYFFIISPTYVGLVSQKWVVLYARCLASSEMKRFARHFSRAEGV